MQFIFLHVDKHHSFFKLALLFLAEVARHVQSTQKRKLVIFLQCSKKNVLQQLLCYIVMQNIQIFCRGPIVGTLSHYKVGFENSKFLQKGRFQIFPIKKEGLVK